MVDSTTQEIKDSWKDTIQALIDLGGQAVGLDAIAEQQGITKQAVSKRFPEIKEEGYITVEGKQKPYIYKLTGDGYRVVDSTPYRPGEVDSSSSKESDRLNRRLHGLTAYADVQGSEVVPEKWMGRMRNHERVNFSKKKGVNESLIWTNRFFIRLHKKSATIQCREGCNYNTDSDIEAFLRFHEDLQELLKWIERASGVSMDLDNVDLRHAELAFEEHHLAKIVKNIGELSLSDFTVEDEEIGKEVATLDDSFKEELETMSAERAEEIGRPIDAELRQYVFRPKAIERRHGFENELLTQDITGQEAAHGVRQAIGMQEQLQETATEVEGVQEEVSDMKEKQDQLLQLKQEERKTREQEKELRRTVAQSVLKHEEELEDLKESVDQIGLVQELVEKVEDLEGKISEMEGSSRETPVDKIRSGRENTELADNIAGEADLTSFSISTSSGNNASTGKQGKAPDEGDKFQVETSKLTPGLKFQDLREDTLLEIDSVELEETSAGMLDMASIRKCGTTRIVYKMHIGELARLLNTGRFEVRDL